MKRPSFARINLANVRRITLANKIEELLEDALEAANKIDRAAGKSSSLIEIAGIYLRLGQKPRCLEILAEALKVIDLIKQPEEKAKQLAWAAKAFQDAGDNTKARELFLRASLLARATETPAQKASALYSIACEYAEAKLNDEAGKILSELYELVIDPETGVDIACELVNLADIRTRTRQPGRAMDMLEKSLKIAWELKDNWFKTERLIDIADIYTMVGPSEDVIKILNEAQTVTGFVDEVNRPYFLLRIADAFTASGCISESRVILTSTLGIVNKDEIAYSKSGDLIEAAGIYLQLKDKPAAINLLAQTETIIGNIENIQDKILRLLEAARSYIELEQSEKALDLTRKIKALISEIVDNKSRLTSPGRPGFTYGRT